MAVTEGHESRIKRFYSAVMVGDTSRLREFVHADADEGEAIDVWVPGERVRWTEDGLNALHDGLGRLEIEPVDVVTRESQVVVRWRATGVAQGTYGRLTVDADDDVVLKGTDVVALAYDGMVTDHLGWIEVDRREAAPAPPRDNDADAEKDDDPIGRVLTSAGRTIRDKQEKAWRLHVHAPRWSLDGCRHESNLALGLLLVASALAVAGWLLAWHLINRYVVAAGSAGNASSTPAAPLAVQIGSWSAVLLIFGAALAAGFTVLRAQRLEMNVSAQPSAAAEAVRARELELKAVETLVRFRDGAGGAPPDAAALTAELQKANSALDTLVENSSPAPSGGSQNNNDGSASSSVDDAGATVVDPATTLSPKVAAATAAGATSVAFWIVAATTFWHTVGPTLLTTLSTGVTAAGAAIAGWLKKDALRTKQTVTTHSTG